MKLIEQQLLVKQQNQNYKLMNLNASLPQAVTTVSVLRQLRECVHLFFSNELGKTNLTTRPLLRLYCLTYGGL